MRIDGSRDVLWNEALGQYGFNDAVRFIENFDGGHNGLIRGALLPARIETMTPHLMRQTADAAARLGASLRCGTALESFPKYRAAGVKFAKSTDSYPRDMIRNIDVGVHIPKLVEARTDAGSAADIFRAATLGGATALGRDDLGRLAVGAKADMIVVSLTNRRIGMIEDPIRTLHMNCTGADIVTVIINGRVVMGTSECLVSTP